MITENCLNLKYTENVCVFTKTLFLVILFLEVFRY